MTVSFDIDSREWQGRWFTSINAWKVERAVVSANPASAAGITPEQVMPSAPAAPDFGPANPIDDLPF